MLISGVLGIFYLNLFYAFLSVYFHIDIYNIVSLPTFLFRALGLFELNISSVFNIIINILAMILSFVYQFAIGIIIGLIYYRFRYKTLKSAK